MNLSSTPPSECAAPSNARVMNALEVLARMGLGPKDTASAETFLRMLGERGMWVIENPISMPLPPDGEKEVKRG
jgi:hypothetical protein